MSIVFFINSIHFELYTVVMEYHTDGSVLDKPTRILFAEALYSLRPRDNDNLGQYKCTQVAGLITFVRPLAESV